MFRKFKPWWLACCSLMVTPAAWAVDLVGVLDLAEKNDPILRAAEYRRDAAQENKTQARANFLPSLSGSAGINRGNQDTAILGEKSSSDIDNYNWGASLVQSIYNQANFENMDIARGQISEADAVYQIALEDFLVRVAERYFLVLTLTDGVKFAEAEEKALQRQYEQAEQRFEVGLTAVTDVHEARASYDNARARSIVARNNLADAKEALRELTGTYFEEYDALQAVLPLVEPDPANAEDWVELALVNNPSVLALRASVDVAESNVRLQRSGHYPSLQLVGSYTDFTNNAQVIYLPDPVTASLGVTDYQIGLRLNVPIYQGGYVSSRTRQAGYLLDARSQDLEDVQRSTVRQARNSYRGVLGSIEEVGAFGQALISAQSALEATQAGFEVGTRTIVDVLIAEQRLYNAQRENSLARHTYILNHLRLKRVAGLLVDQDLRVVNQLLE